MPDHPVWSALEKSFRTRIGQAERQKIVFVLREVLSQRPDEDMEALVMRVTQAVLAQRSKGG